MDEYAREVLMRERERLGRDQKQYAEQIEDAREMLGRLHNRLAWLNNALMSLDRVIDGA